MNVAMRWLVGAASCGWLAAAVQPRIAGTLSAVPPGMLNYQAYCEVSAPNSANGYVRNAGADTYQVDGYVRFVFSNDKGISHSALEVPANAFIPPRQTVLVVSSPLPFSLADGEKCGFEVAGAISGVSRGTVSSPPVQ